MTTEDRIKAFSMRAAGATWEEIGAEMHYAPRFVERELKTVVERLPNAPKIIYPKLYAAIYERYGGSIEQLAVSMHVSPHRLRRVLLGLDEPTDSLTDKLRRELQFDESEDLWNV